MHNTGMDTTKVFEAYQRLQSLQGASRGVDLELAKELSELKKDENYRIIMGDTEASWKAFLCQPEINLHVAKADRLVKIYQKYIQELGLSTEDIYGVDSNILVRLASVVTKDNVGEWIEKAKNLSRADVYREIKFGAIDEMKCEHNYTRKIVCTCVKCGTRKIEHE